MYFTFPNHFSVIIKTTGSAVCLYITPVVCLYIKLDSCLQTWYYKHMTNSSKTNNIIILIYKS